MANILALIPMNAANFDSGSAAAGTMLTADGSGGAGWEAASTPVSDGSANVPFLGIFNPIAPTFATQLYAAYTGVVGRPPQPYDAALFRDIDGMTRMTLVFWKSGAWIGIKLPIAYGVEEEEPEEPLPPPG